MNESTKKNLTTIRASIAASEHATEELERQLEIAAAAAKLADLLSIENALESFALEFGDRTSISHSLSEISDFRRSVERKKSIQEKGEN